MVNFIILLDEILECSICHGSVNGIEKILENYPKEVEINLLEIADDTCNKLPGQFYQRVCLFYFPLIFKFNFLIIFISFYFYYILVYQFN